MEAKCLSFFVLYFDYYGYRIHKLIDFVFGMQDLVFLLLNAYVLPFFSKHVRKDSQTRIPFSIKLT